MKKIVTALLAAALARAGDRGGDRRCAMPVFDSANYSQNLLTAARTLQQINQQIQSLQNEAQMLVNQQQESGEDRFSADGGAAAAACSRSTD